MADSVGALIIDLESTTLSHEEAALLKHPLIGGVILFSRNYETRSQLISLCHQIRSTRTTPLLIMVDQEGGRVQRFIHEFTRLPAMGSFGVIYEQNPQLALKQSQEAGKLMASELLAVGIDLSLAPVLDLNKELNQVIGERAFHRDPLIVVELANAFIEGMKMAGMAAVGKHFPGHGSVNLDSHVSMPIDERPLSAIEQSDMVPFAKLIQSKLVGIMAAHIIFPAIDHLAVGFSAFWLQKVLRNRLGFEGIIFSDDLNMEGANISTNYAERVKVAKQAGCDFILLCNNRLGVLQTINSLPALEYQVPKEKWQALQGNRQLSPDTIT